MGVTVLGVDGGNSKTELVAATDDGQLLAHVRGPGSNSHGVGADGTARVIEALAREARVQTPAAYGVFFLCGADEDADIADLRREIDARALVREGFVDNDTFAILRAGTERPDALAVVCGSGINCVGRTADGRISAVPNLGWETGDWGGADDVGREALFLAVRAEDGRGQPTELVELAREQFGVARTRDIGSDVHYKRLPQTRLGELAPQVLAAAARGDAVATVLVERLADEIVLLVRRALAELELEQADVVLGGGMLSTGEGPLHEAVLARLPGGLTPFVLRQPPVLGAALAALDAVGATDAAKTRLREALRGG